MSGYYDDVIGLDDDLGDCPYRARFDGVEGADPRAVCYRMGSCTAAEEPECVTCEPTDGWRRPYTLLTTPGYTPVPERSF